ncbi:MAG: polysaccharide deacetylase family protein [Actinomycetota bacterium]
MQPPPPRRRRLSLFALGVFALSLLAATAAQLTAPPAVAAAPAADEPDKPVVYLTFDDGPGPSTPAFLDLLEQHGVTGTFFATGRAITTNPDTARRIVADGHTIANHTWNHPRLTALSDQAIRDEFDRTTEVITSVTGMIPVCYRPPYGATNARVHDQAVAAGLPNAEWTTGRANSHFGLWDIDTNDWRLSLASTTWSEAAMRRQLDRASDGDTILLHDGFSRRPRSLRVLSAWLAVNHDRFDFRPLPGCDPIPYQPEPLEPAMADEAPETWHRFRIARLYRAYFDRAPDAEGWEYWNREHATGTSLAEISYWFSQSSEFNATTTLDDEGFVRFVYDAVLDREPDPDGFAYWLDQLNGNLNRGELVLYFSDSDEYINRTVAAITGDCYQADVAESYRCLAGTLPTYDW